MAMRMREYRVHVDYANIDEYADADEILIHIIDAKIFATVARFWCFPCIWYLHNASHKLFDQLNLVGEAEDQQLHYGEVEKNG